MTNPIQLTYTGDQTGLLMWHKKSFSFSAEISDLKEALDGVRIDLAVFEITNAKTGGSRTFRFTRTNLDTENDVMSWTFTSNCGTVDFNLYND